MTTLITAAKETNASHAYAYGEVDVMWGKLTLYNNC